MPLHRLVLFLGMLCLLSQCTYYCGPNLLNRHFKNEPVTSQAVYNCSKQFSTGADYKTDNIIIKRFADERLPDTLSARKHDVVRVMLAKLTEQREVEQVNRLLMQLKPWSGHGTQWALHRHGDYDFTEIAFCSLLYLFADKPQLLYPETREHLAHTLIVNCGAKQGLRMPGSAGLMRETENHILMGEISRYLKNQWLHEHGDSNRDNDNSRNGLEPWMLRHLNEKFRGGFYEFNSDPYSGYSITALITLYSFTHSDTVRSAACKLLNEVMYEYSLGSIDFARYPPFRRQRHRAVRPGFGGDPASSIARVLTSLKMGGTFEVPEKQHGLITLLLRYRLNDSLVAMLTQTHKNYFALLGHGRKGSPEIYTSGNGYVLSAGGVTRGLASQLAARPTMLLLNNHVTNRDSCFYICSPGKMDHWNNTGVYKNFACAAGSAHVPPQYKPVCEKNGWQVFTADSLLIFVCQQKGLALLLVMPATGVPPQQVLDKLLDANRGLNPKKQFRLADGDLLAYQLHSPKNLWVMVSANHRRLNRRFDGWERMEVGQGGDE